MQAFPFEGPSGMVDSWGRLDSGIGFCDETPEGIETVGLREDGCIMVSPLL